MGTLGDVRVVTESGSRKLVSRGDDHRMVNECEFERRTPLVKASVWPSRAGRALSLDLQVR